MKRWIAILLILVFAAMPGCTKQKDDSSLDSSLGSTSSESVISAEEQAVEYLRNRLSNYFDTQDKLFVRAPDEVIDGVENCMVFQVLENLDDHTSTVGFYALTPDMEKVYELDVVADEYRLIYDIAA